MKFSIYNTFIPFDKGIALIYNASSNNYVVTRANGLSLMGDSNSINNIESDPNLTSIFEEAGIIIDDNQNEQDSLRKLINNVNLDESVYMLHVNPTLQCNFQCWYCYESHVNGFMTDMTLTAVKKHISYVITQKSNLKSFQLSFFGGEPMLRYWQTAYPLLKYTKELCKKDNINFISHFTTNGYLIDKKIVESVKEFGTQFQITLDGAKEQHNKVRHSSSNDSYERILENIKALSLEGLHVVLRINYTIENLDTIKSVISDLAFFSKTSKQNIRVDFQRVWQDFDKSSTSKISEEKVKDKVRRYIHALSKIGIIGSAYFLSHGIPHTCYADKQNQLLVNWNGDVFKCTARDFKTENRIGVITPDGEIIYDKDSPYPQIITKIPSEKCLNCRIAPLCGGGCHRQYLEHNFSEACILRYSEKDKDRMVLDRFESLIQQNKSNNNHNF